MNNNNQNYVGLLVEFNTISLKDKNNIILKMYKNSYNI